MVASAVMVTGHRQIVPAGWSGNPWPDNNPIVEQHHAAVRKLMASTIWEWHLKSAYNDFISGMALGADTLFAEAVLFVRDELNVPIRLIAAVPFKGQEGKWTARSKERYNSILARANEVVIVSPGAYTAAKMQIRNQWMVDRSAVVMAVWNGTASGGTWNCIQYARQRNKWMVQLHPQKLTIERM